jgi:flagellar biosynthesis/type III secretory pathway M-ring protein FliF/YscJ
MTWWDNLTTNKKIVAVCLAALAIFIIAFYVL